GSGETPHRSGSKAMLATFDWSRVRDFIEARNPGYTDRIVGVSDQLLAALAQSAPSPLPQSYLSYIAACGVDRGGFEVFPGYACDVADLLARPGGAQRFAVGNWFRVAVHLGSEDEGADVVLDLNRSKGVDAPLLVAHKDGVEDIEISWGERLLHDAFERFELGRRAAGSVLILLDDIGDNSSVGCNDATWLRVLETLDMLGGRALLTGSRTMWFGATPTV